MTTPLAVVRIGRDRRFVADPAGPSMALLAAILLAATPAAAGDTLGPVPTSRPAAQERMVGLFTGELVNGTPVYRLPPITVSASRKAELARIDREEQSKRARQARARTAARPPA
jgi:hypothetical protein